MGRRVPNDRTPVILLAFANDRVDNARYLRELGEEQRGIREVLGQADADGVVQVVERTNVTLEDIATLFQSARHRNRIAIFHYGGHADGYKLLLESRAGSQTAAFSGGLSGFLAQQKGLTLVVLNGCATQQQATDLLAAGIPAVIATSSAIADSVARMFAIALYRGLAGGASLREAFDEATNLMRADRSSPDEAYDWRLDIAHPEGWPWDLYTKDPDAASWTLSDVAGDPFFGLPDLPQGDLPASPFRHLESFTRAHAEVFFGRGRAIRALFRTLTSEDTPLHLLYGQSGVGKSSFLDAGLLPRLGQVHEVIYTRRIADRGLADTLATAIGSSAPLRDAWCAREQNAKRPLTIVLDQAEEAFTNPIASDAKAELRALCKELAEIFLDRASRPQGRLLLSFRKEWVADITARLEEANLVGLAGATFLERLDREGIIEAIACPARVRRLRDRYHLTIEPALPELIADDLLEDTGSQIAPVLQILLSRMWERARRDSPTSPRFDTSTYQLEKARGNWLDEFVTQELKLLSRQHQELAASGLILDYLHAHTSEHGALELTGREVRHRYSHLSGELPTLREHALERRLLVEPPAENPDEASRDATRLSHDTLAPLIRKRFDSSTAPGQVARRVLESRVTGWTDGRTGDALDGVGLRQVEAGAAGMRAWTDDERRLIEASRKARYRRRVALAGAAAILLVLTVLYGIDFARNQRSDAINLAEALASRSRDSARSGRLLNENAALAVASVRRLMDLNFPSADADEAIRGALALLVPIDSEWTVASSARQVAISSNGVIAAATADSVHVTGRLNSPFAFPTAKSHILSVSSDGEVVVAVGSDTTLHVWGVTARGERWRHSFDGAIQGVGWSSAARRVAVLVAASRDVELWDVDTKSVERLRHAREVSSFTVSPDGSHLATISDSTLTTWNANTRQPIAVRKLPEALTDVWFNPAGNRFVVTARPQRKAWVGRVDGDDVRILSTSGLVVKAALDRLGRMLVLGTEDGRLDVIDVPTGQSVATFHHDDRVNSVSFSPDGKRLLSASRDSTARIWAVAEGVEIARLVHDAPVHEAEFITDSTILAVSADGKARRWLLHTSAYIWRREMAGKVSSLAFQPVGSLVAAATFDSVRVWNGATGENVNVFSGSGIYGVGFVPGTDDLIIGGLAGTRRIDVPTGHDTSLTEGLVTALGFGPHGEIATALHDGSVVIRGHRSTDSMTLPPRTTTQLRLTAIDPEGQYLLAVDLVGRLSIRRIADHGLTFEDTIAGSQVAVDGAMRFFAKAGPTGVTIVRRAPSGDVVATLFLPPVPTLALSPLGTHLATGGTDGVAHIWDIASATEVSRVRHRDTVEIVAFSPDGRYLITATARGVVTAWPWRPEDLVQAACSQLRARVSTPEWPALLRETKARAAC